MPVTVRVPTPLRPLTGNTDQVEASGSSVREVIDDLESKYPGIKGRLCDEKGEIRRFINFYVNDEDIRFQKNQDTPVKDGDIISVVPAIAGG
ncbi:MAG: MoaD/ThiS family protein [Candidatus Brocadiales bacterium]|nr:MoaD/ThiS family protein [Candidatus Bathyanammoxibius amoris]